MNKQEQADKMVNNFVNNFVETFGYKPKVQYKINLNVPTLNEIFEAVNKELQILHPDKSIDDKTKETIVLKYRYLYCSIAKEFGYTLVSIGKLIDKDHSTVTHSVKQIQKTNELRVKILKSF